ncbi:MAG: hypothetical protein GEU99_23635 [Luteitalea sp.]|nr:hypothetical protein [Luteitalea sp.]
MKEQAELNEQIQHAPLKPLEVPEPVRPDAVGPASMTERLPGAAGTGYIHGNRHGWPHRAGEPEPTEMHYEGH